MTGNVPIPGQNIQLWTVQSQARIRQLWTDRRIYGRMPTLETAYPEWVAAFQWMAQQLVERGMSSEGIAPCWAWYQWERKPGGAKPDLCFKGHLPEGVAGACIELAVPRDLVLLSQFELWESILVGAPIAMNQAESLRFEQMADHGALDKYDIQDTWSRIFDLDAGDPELWGCLEERSVQACLPYIDMCFVRRIEPLSASGN